MNDAKYIGPDVRQATISAAVLDSDRRLIMESILEKKAATVLQFVHGLRGSLHITFEEGTCAAWLHALLQPQHGLDNQSSSGHRRTISIDIPFHRMRLPSI
jgi:hypothetical protein